jgi:hypothetical protein
LSTGNFSGRFSIDSHVKIRGNDLRHFVQAGDFFPPALQLIYLDAIPFNDKMILLAESGDAFCAAPDFNIEEADNFIVQNYYCSIGR